MQCPRMGLVFQVTYEIRTILQFNLRVAIKYQTLSGHPGGRFRSATHLQCVIEIVQRPVRDLNLRGLPVSCVSGNGTHPHY